MSGHTKYNNVLRAIGYDDTDADILSLFIDGHGYDANEVIDLTGYSRGKTYQVLAKYVEENKLYIVRDKKNTYYITTDFLKEIKIKIENILNTFIPVIEKQERKSTNIVIQNVINFCNSLNYSINPISYLSKKNEPRYFDTAKKIYDYIIEGEFRYCLGFIDESKYSDELLRNIFKRPDEVLFIAGIQSNDCISGILIVDSNIRNIDSFIKNLKRNVSTFPPNFKLFRDTEYPTYTGIQENMIYIIKTDENVEEKLLEYFNEIKDRNFRINAIIKDLNNKIDQIDKSILDSEVRIRNLVDRRYLLISSGRVQKDREKMSKIIDVIRDIAMREKHNLDGIKSSYRGIYVEINNHIESYYSNLYLPKINIMSNYLNKLSVIEEKFNSVLYELQSVQNNIMRMRYIDKAEYFNPFIITIPYEPNPFILNQEESKHKLNFFINDIIKSNESSIRFLMDNQGSGKSHILQNYVIPECHKNKIIPLYIKCSFQTDLLDCIKPSIDNIESFPIQIKNAFNIMITEDKFRDLRDFILYLQEVMSYLKSHDYNGIVIIFDEFENLLRPFLKTGVSIITRPTIIRQVYELISSGVPNMGYILSGRKQAYDLIKNNINIKNIDDFVIKLDQLNMDDIKKLINHRYEMWNIKKVNYDDEVIEKIILITNGNTRDILRYLRDLYWSAFRKETDNVNINDLDTLPPLPIFQL